ncbi:SCO3374 family protein [Streptomyces paludis]|uniref:Proline-rich protein n=1 Tax=Streptomyces paludis TaxID=2282738 RepID=A0A345HP89_9ACTN|nr:SCO3374 family protein [Streptomyces paludis]AXG78513.1 hypothetical protein DVK44_13210 [Streptomyces paludis]
MALPVPPPRAAPEGGPARQDSTGRAGGAGCAGRDLARWYEEGLGWPTAAGPPVALLTGVRFDALELPADAGAALLRRIGPTGPVALHGDRMRLLVAVGGADELPGLLDWLEWGGITLGLTALGAGGRMTAPVPPRWGAATAQGAAVWLRPPVPGRERESALPAFVPFGQRGGSGGGAPDLVRLVGAAALECHRARLLRRNTFRTNTQPLAFS